jgi:hypothetical protein
MQTCDGDPPSLTDSDADTLAWQFLNSDYVGDTYLRSSLDQRLSSFLRRRGLVRVADDGDLFNILLDRVMANISRHPGTTTSSAASVRPTPKRQPDPVIGESPRRAGLAVNWRQSVER